MKNLLRVSAFLATWLAVAPPAAAQIWDTTGNGLLNGDYFFRHVMYQVGADNGDLSAAIAVTGTISFDGESQYQVNATFFDGIRVGPLVTSGSYSISASGYGFFDNEVLDSGSVFGSVSNGVFAGSSTESGFNDLFIAVEAGSATNSTLQGLYKMAYLNTVNGVADQWYNALADLNANGQGGIGNVPLHGFIADAESVNFEQTESGVTYTFNQGVGAIHFPVQQQLAIQGDQVLLISPDGNFIFGGGVAAFDFYVGVRRASDSEPVVFSGLFLQAGINLNASGLPDQAVLDTYYGTLQADRGQIRGHERFFSVFESGPRNYTFSDSFPDLALAEYVNDATATEYIMSRDGAVRIGLGRGPFLGISVAVKTPDLSGSGVFLLPTGVVNAASFAPFTAGVVRGELLSLFGSNLAPETKVAETTTFPTTLDGVQVLFNNRAAPIYFVSPGQVSAIVPYGIPDSERIVQIQVINNGENSNAITAFRFTTSPGIFTVPSSGIGFGAILHADFTLVDENHPARPDEVVLVFLTGLGDVFPTIPDGTPGPSGQLSRTPAGSIAAFIDGLPADVSYSGLAPLLTGLYQMNIRVPSDAREGNLFVDVCGPASCTSQVLIPVAGTLSSDEVTGASDVHPRRRWRRR